MRLWHKDLIAVLPKQQLIGQWRECCAIARNIAVKGSPNHILVNKVMDYSPIHYYAYCRIVYEELQKRDYKCDWSKLTKWIIFFPDGNVKCHVDELFEGWHNDRYLMQCLHNLQEKYDCGGITTEEWCEIERLIHEKFL